MIARPHGEAAGSRHNDPRGDVETQRTDTHHLTTERVG
jgi:hypothetical protein